MKKLTIFFLSLFFFSTKIQYQGCSCIQQRVNIRNCRFTLNAVKLKDIGIFGADFLVTINVKNPNTVDAILDGFDFQFFINNFMVVEGSTQNKLKIPAGKQKKLFLNLSVEYQNIAKLLSVLKKKKLKLYTFKGTVAIDTRVGYFTFPVEFKGRFK